MSRGTTCESTLAGLVGRAVSWLVVIAVVVGTAAPSDVQAVADEQERTTPRSQPAIPDAGFWPTPKMLVLNFPANPTAQCVDLPFFEKVIEIAREHNIWVLGFLFHAVSYAFIMAGMGFSFYPGNLTSHFLYLGMCFYIYWVLARVHRMKKGIAPRTSGVILDGGRRSALGMEFRGAGVRHLFSWHPAHDKCSPGCT